MKILLSILLLVTIISIGIGASDCQGPPVPTPQPTAIPGASLEARVSALEQAVAGGGGGTAPGAYIPILPAAMGGTGTSSYNIGDILYATGGTALGRLGIGVSGYSLISNGPNALTSLSWVAPGGGTAAITSLGTVTSGAWESTTSIAWLRVVYPWAGSSTTSVPWSYTGYPWAGSSTTSVPWNYLGNMTSAQLGVRLSDEVGTGQVSFTNSTTLVTPTLANPTVNGNLQIGSNTAQSQLHLNGATYASAGMRFTDDTSGHTSGDGYLIGIGGDETFQFYVYENQDYKLALNATEVLRIKPTGNIGLGTAIPGGATTSGTFVFTLRDGTAPAGILDPPGSLFYSASGQPYSYTSAGRTTLLRYTSGKTSIPIGDTAVSVTHNFGTSPGQILLTWADQSPSAVAASAPLLWQSLITGTGFTLNITNSMSNRPSISWTAIP